MPADCWCGGCHPRPSAVDCPARQRTVGTVIRFFRATEREFDRGHFRERHRTRRDPNHAEPLAPGLDALAGIDEIRLRPGAHASADAPGDSDIVTYVRRGGLTCTDASGLTRTARAGEFQMTGAELGLRCIARNASPTEWVQYFHLALRGGSSEPVQGQARCFSGADRGGRLCLVASGDAGQGVMRLRQNARIYSATLAEGNHLVHELAAGRCAWLYMVAGSAALRDRLLRAGDSAAIAVERAVSFTARQATEVLLLDLGDPV